MKTFQRVNTVFQGFTEKYLYLINVGLIIFLLSPLFLFLNNQFSQDQIFIENTSIDVIVEGCGIKLPQNEIYSIEETLFPRDIYVFPQISNLECLGVPNKIIYSTDGDKLSANLEVGSNYKLFKYINLLGNYILIFLVIINLRKYIPHIILLYLLFNFGIYKLLIPIEPISEIILPIAPFEIGDQYVRFFVNNLFLIVLSLKVNKNNIYLLLFIYFVFISIDYLGIFVVLLFLKNRFSFNFSKNEENIFLSIPVFFYVIRIISGIFVYFDNVWINLAQTMYRGYTRYADSQRAFFFLKCNGDPDAEITEGYFLGIECAPMGGGPLDAILPFYGNVNTWSKITGSISTFLLIIIYFRCLKYFKNYKILLPLFFLSPPLVHLTHYGNDDFVILLINLYALWNIKKYTFFKLFLILLTALFNLHPTSILVGIAVVAVKKSDYKIFFNTSILLMIFSVMFFWDQITNSAHIIGMPWYDYGFGIYNDLVNLKSKFSITYNYGFIIIFLIISSVLYSKKFKSLYKDFDFNNLINIKEKFNTKYDEYAIIGISFWYVISFLYSNVSYRLPSFYLLFLIMFIISNNKIKALIIGLMFLEPVIYHSELFVRNIFATVNNISHYIIFLILLRCLYEYTYPQVTKLFRDLKNKNISYSNS